jgi:hypothetical protein
LASRAEVTAFDCVLKQAENAVAVVAIVLGSINLRIPMKPAMHSNLKPATRSDLKPATVPI